MKEPKVSVVLSTYNHIQYLSACVESILTQTFKDFEFIIINDGSTDGTKEYLDGIKDERLKITHFVQNMGIVPAYNYGLKSARGKYITWISSDNIHLPKFLETLAFALDENPDVDFVYSAFHWVNNSGQVFRTNTEVYFGPHGLLLDNPGMASFMYRSKIHEDLGYLEDIGVCSDTDFWLRMSEKGYKMLYIPKILVYFLWDTNVDSYKRFQTTPESMKKMVTRAVKRRRAEARDRKMRILFIVPNFVTDHYAGVEVYTYNLSKQLLNNGIEVSILCPKVGPPGISKQEFQGIEVWNIVYDEDFTNFKNTIENKDIENLLIKFMDLNLFRFDIVHFHHCFGFPFNIIRMFIDWHYPVIITVHDFWFMCHRMFLQNWKGDVHNGPLSIDECVQCATADKELAIDQIASTYYLLAYRQLNNKEILEKVDLVSFPSDYVYNVFVRHGWCKNKTKILPLGILPIKMEKKTERRAFTFGYFGVIHPIKRVDLLVDAFFKLEGDYRLRIWGDGNEKFVNALKEKIQKDNRISYCGKYTPEQLGQILSEIDVFINPSITESYSFTVREALSVGIPVIASHIPVMREVIVHQGNGYLFLDEEDLYFALQQATNPNILKQWKKGIIKTKIANIYDDAKNWIHIYKEIYRKKVNLC